MWLIITGVEHSGKTTICTELAKSFKHRHVVYAHCDVWPAHSPRAYERLLPLATSSDWLVIQDRAWIDEWVYSQAQQRQPHFSADLVEWWIGRLVAVGAVPIILTKPYLPPEPDDPPLEVCVHLYREWARRYPYWRIWDKLVTIEQAQAWLEEAMNKRPQIWYPYYVGPEHPRWIVVGAERPYAHDTRYAAPLWTRPDLIEAVAPSDWPYTSFCTQIPDFLGQNLRARSEIPNEKGIILLEVMED